MEICQNRRGIYIDMKYLDENRVTIIYEMPLNEIIYENALRTVLASVYKIICMIFFLTQK